MPSSGTKTGDQGKISFERGNAESAETGQQGGHRFLLTWGVNGYS